MGTILPPVANTAELSDAVKRVPAPLRDDAIQEAWVAHLSKQCPVKAVQSFASREKYLLRRGQPLPDQES